MEFEQPTTSHRLHQQHQQQPAFLQKQQSEQNFVQNLSPVWSFDLNNNSP